jgi:hypothetical protein
MRPILLVGQLVTSRQSDSIDPAIPSAEPARTDRCVCRRRVTPAPGKSRDKRLRRYVAAPDQALTTAIADPRQAAQTFHRLSQIPASRLPAKPQSP